jgi:hypothetical protein
MEGLLFILFFVILLPIISVIMGIVKMCSSDEQKRKAGLKFLLGGILLFGIFVVIGFSMCSNMSFGGGH